ncbi:MAG: hypothetical protein NTX05_05245 [Fusobacteria bacterium]|nr:hypothetical protein [Fusobacteriota bacterium]
MLKGTESGLLIQIKDIEKDIKELELKLRSKMFITRIDFFIYPKDEVHFERLEALLKGFGFKLLIAEERANRTSIRLQEKQERLESAKLEKESLGENEEKVTEKLEETNVVLKPILKQEKLTVEHKKEIVEEVANVEEKIKEESSENSDLFTFFSNLETLMIQKNLRSGQRVEHSGNIVIVGDINSGAEVFAEGDIYVFGKIMGTVHAGKNGNIKSSIIALSIESQRVRIASEFLEEKISKSQSGFYERASINAKGKLIIEEIGK